MMRNLFLVVAAVSCILVARTGADGVDDAIDKVGDTYNDAKDFVAGNETTATGNSTKEDRPLLNAGSNPMTKNGLTNSQDDQDESITMQGNGIRCNECIIEKDTSNKVQSYYDTVLSQQKNTCSEYECKQTGHNWCLVTYYRTRAYLNSGERKIEVHECGSKSTRDADYRCKELYREDDHAVITSCESKRSSAQSAFSFLLPLISVLTFALLH